MSNCHCNTGFTQDGSGQLGRYLKALDPSYAPVDDRSVEDLLLYAKRYAGQVRFYDIPGSSINDGEKPERLNWREFFRRDMAVIAASVAVLNISNVKKEYEELRERLDEDPSHEKLAATFALSISIATRIDRWYSVAIPENPLRTDLDLAINSHLRLQMKQIMAYEDGYKFVDSKNPLKLDYSGIQNDEVWGLKDAVDPDASIYQGTTLDDKIRNAALYADDIFNNFFSALQSLIDNGPGYMTFALEKYPAHQPHMALFIAFLQIFKLAQEQMNGLTGRMLDFYYKEVLQLTPKDSIPDKTHVIFELAKDVAQYDIAKGTSLDAGKDAGNKALVYKTSTDLVINQAKVAELKTIFIDKKNPVGTQKNKTIRGIYASPVANSADGYGTAFTEANPKWPTFGKGMSVNTGSANICKSIDAIKENLLTAPGVQTGFSIASPQLVLQGGKRLIALKVPGINALTGNQLSVLTSTPFEIWLTGEKDWIKVDKVMDFTDVLKFMKFFAAGLSIFNPETDEVETSYFIDAAHDTIYVYLPVTEKSVIAFDSKLHTGYNYKTSWPVMQVMLNDQMNIDEEVYNTLKATDISLEVRVGTINPGRVLRDAIFKKDKINIPEYNFDGLETVVIQTAEGLFASDKPFNPFTQYPGPGKSLYIGSSEVFNKPLGRLAVNLKRTQQHLVQQNQSGMSPGFKMMSINNIDNKYLGVSVLKNKAWKEVSTNDGTDFDQTDLTENILNLATRNAAGTPPAITALTLDRTPVETVKEFKNQVSKGFIRIDFLPSLDNSNGQLTNMQASQELAPEVEIKEISVNYYSVLTQLDSAIDQLFHVYPFGVVETYFGTATGIIRNPGSVKSSDSSFSALDKQKNYLLVNANNLLLPQYTFLNAYSAFSGTASANAGGVYSAGKKDILSNLVLASSGVQQSLVGGNNQYSDKLQEQGMLFIGLEKAAPLQSVSLLFQFAEGSADDEDNDPPAINWSYLTNNEWRPLKGEDIVSDGTFGFQTTGIVKLNIPADATNNNTIITEGLHWFAASVSENAQRIPKLINVVSQAAEVVFEDNNNDQSHFDAALPAGSITKLSVKAAEVSKVEQPFASFDGKHKEVSREFYTRVSERLRHKGRAINSWDYEHLVLNRFPSIYKVKCITATDPNCLCRQEDGSNKKRKVFKSFHFPDNLTAAQRDALLAEINLALNNNPKLLMEVVFYSQVEFEVTDAIKALFKKSFQSTFPGINFNRFNFVVSSKIAPDSSDAVLYLPVDLACCGPQVAPGHVLLVPVANLKNRNSINPLQPKTSRRILLEIEEYLKKLTSPFVKVHAKNPVYEQVIVGFRVQFYTGTDKGFYLKKLNEEIVHYLTPWAFDETADVAFGQKIYASSIINFIEERPYVDFITDFVMGVCKDECCKEDVTAVTATRVLQPLREFATIKASANRMNEASVVKMANNFSFIRTSAAAPAAAAVQKITGVVMDANTGSAVPGATVTIKGSATAVITAVDGSFTLQLDPATAVLTVQSVGYNAAEFAVAGQQEMKIALTLAAEIVKEVVVVKSAGGDSVAEILAGICGCDDLETQIGNSAATKGEIVAKPSTARSILVSVPQHVIIPYIAPVKETPCDVRKQKIAAAIVVEPDVAADNSGLQPKDTIVNTDKANTGQPVTDTAVAGLNTAKPAVDIAADTAGTVTVNPDKKVALPVADITAAVKDKSITAVKTEAGGAKTAKAAAKKTASPKAKKNNK